MKANDKSEVLVVGDILMDFQYWVQGYPVRGGDEAITTAAENAGGSAASTAVALGAQGVACAFHGRVGADELGRQLTDQMESFDVNLSCLDVFGSTGYTVTIIDPSGERTMLSFRGGDGYQPQITDALRRTLQEIKVLYISGYLLADKDQASFAIDLAREAHGCGCYVMMDTAPVIGKVDPTVVNAFLQYVDVLMPNKMELLTLAGKDGVDEAIDVLLERVPCLVVKLGSDGSRLVTKTGLRRAEGIKIPGSLDITSPAHIVTPVDTTGAGDSFNAGFIASFLREEAAESWLAMGNQLAAKAIACRGAIACYL